MSSFISVVGEKNTPKSSKSCGCLSNIDTSDFVFIDKILSSIVPSSVLTFSLVIDIPTVSGVGWWCVSTTSSHSWVVMSLERSGNCLNDILEIEKVLAPKANEPLIKSLVWLEN